MEGGTGERAEAAERMAALEWRHGARADLMLDAEFWKALCPLHVEDPQMASLAHASVLQLDPDVIDTCRERMGIEGFFTIPATSLSWAVDVPELAAAIQSLGVAGWSPAFLLVFDEPWVMAHQVRLVMCMQPSGPRQGGARVLNGPLGGTPSPPCAAQEPWVGLRVTVPV